MRLNKFIAQATGMARRKADEAIDNGRVKVNDLKAEQGQQVINQDMVTLDGLILSAAMTQTIMLNKPVGYVCSRDGQGSQTIYDLLPSELHNLKPVGRLDKDSSGLLVLTNDGDLANHLTHPKYGKSKIYEAEINKSLKPHDFAAITTSGVKVADYTSKFQLQKLEISSQKLAKQLVPNSQFLVTLTEGRNRQIRRTFEALGYKVTRLHRTQFGPYQIGDLQAGASQSVK